MLKLLIFAPCQKVIIGEDKSASMIAILETLEIGISGDDLAPDAAAPADWQVLALWERVREVADDMPYEQRIEIVRPDGHVSGGGTIRFTVNSVFQNYRNVMKVPAFPIGLPGRCVLRIALRQQNEEKWLEVAEFPLNIVHKRIEAPNVEGQP